MRKKVNSILEGLHSPIKEAHRPYYDEDVGFAHEDILVVDNRRGLEDAISAGAEKRYAGQFSKFGKLEVSVDIDLTDDDARELVDVADAIHMNFYITNPADGASTRDVLSAVASLKPIKGFKPKYDSRSDVYYIDAEGNDVCDDLLLALTKDGIKLPGKLYHIESADDIERAVLIRRAEDREDVAYRDREYYRSRI